VHEPWPPAWPKAALPALRLADDVPHVANDLAACARAHVSMYGCRVRVLLCQRESHGAGYQAKHEIKAERAVRTDGAQAPLEEEAGDTGNRRRARR